MTDAVCIHSSSRIAHALSRSINSSALAGGGRSRKPSTDHTTTPPSHHTTTFHRGSSGPNVPPPDPNCRSACLSLPRPDHKDLRDKPPHHSCPPRKVRVCYPVRPRRYVFRGSLCNPHDPRSTLPRRIGTSYYPTNKQHADCMGGCGDGVISTNRSHHFQT